MSWVSILLENRVRGLPQRTENTDCECHELKPLDTAVRSCKNAYAYAGAYAQQADGNSS